LQKNQVEIRFYPATEGGLSHHCTVQGDASEPEWILRLSEQTQQASQRIFKKIGEKRKKGI
jgi:hypothetical protein